jgi:hypothetical protein
LSFTTLFTATHRGRCARVLAHRVPPSLVCNPTLHAPFKRSWEQATSPEQAMLGARRKMAHPGHAGQRNVRGSFRGGRGWPLGRRGRRPPACPGRWRRGSGRCARTARGFRRSAGCSCPWRRAARPLAPAESARPARHRRGMPWDFRGRTRRRARGHGPPRRPPRPARNPSRAGARVAHEAPEIDLGQE